MAIKITQPFGFDSNLPNFTRDVINSQWDEMTETGYHSSNPLNLTADEKAAEAAKYDIGHIVYDIYTRSHYIWLGQNDGWGSPSVRWEQYTQE